VWDLLDFIHIKRWEDETIPKFHVRFINTHDKLPAKYQPRHIVVNYAFAFDS
jgi:hypothetical protein